MGTQTAPKLPMPDGVQRCLNSYAEQIAIRLHAANDEIAALRKQLDEAIYRREAIEREDFALAEFVKPFGGYLTPLGTTDFLMNRHNDPE